MKKYTLSIFVFLFGSILSISAQDISTCKDCSIHFFSEAPLENIEATSHSVAGALNLKKKEILFKVPIKTFKFDKSLMQEHFNENYMESDKFPFGILKGQILEDCDLTKAGEYNVTVKGKLTLHGVEKERNFKGVIIVTPDKTIITSKFIVHLKDHNIKIPSAVIKNLAEEVAVTFKGDLVPYKK